MANNGQHAHSTVTLRETLLLVGTTLIKKRFRLVNRKKRGFYCLDNARAHLPNQHFAANAAWFKLALLSYNIASAIKGLCFSPAERIARFKRHRRLFVHLSARMSRFRCKLCLRFCARKKAIAPVQKVWAGFALPTQATAFI